MKKLIIRQATFNDIPVMADIIKSYAIQGLMLKRSKGSLAIMIPNFLIAEIEGEFVGTCGSKIFPDGMLEIISAAVKKEYQGRGIGSELIKAQIERAKKLGIKKIIALTFRPEVFIKIGFVKIRKRQIQGKIWEDCVFCPNNNAEPDEVPDCGENALLYNI